MGQSAFKVADSTPQQPTKKPLYDGQIEDEFVVDVINSEDLVIFSRTNCGFCTKAKTELDQKGIRYRCLELDIGTNCPGDDCYRVIQSLLLMTRMKTVPQIFYKSHLIGGYTELHSMLEKGEIKKE
jgi:glutaredoxin 3